MTFFHWNAFIIHRVLLITKATFQGVISNQYLTLKDMIYFRDIFKKKSFVIIYNDNKKLNVDIHFKKQF